MTVTAETPSLLERAHCAKCRGELLYVAALPHPKAPQMRKTTFVCYPCNRTWTYPLAAEVAGRYEAEALLAGQGGSGSSVAEL
jgi:hypothetical protein